MKRVLLLSSALTLGVMNPALAGGPVVVAEEPEVVVEKPASSAGFVIPLLLLAVVVAVVAGDDDEVVNTPPSDIRLKEDIVKVGTNKLGLGVYQYRYRGLEGVWEGVMAQEVEVMHPGAIRMLPGGYKAVDYARLGLSPRLVA